jgi:hypothetical protein
MSAAMSPPAAARVPGGSGVRRRLAWKAGGVATEPDAAGLRAGYTYLRRGTASYAGVLRSTETGALVWKCAHDHLVAVSARRCAEAELDRRREGARVVVTVLHCEEDGQWFDPAKDRTDFDWRDGLCPRCGVPMLREKVLVLEAVDARTDPDANLTWVK